MEMNTEVILKIQQLQEQGKIVEEKLQIIDQQASELSGFGISLGELEKNKSKEMLASLGKGVFIKSNIVENKLFVEVGSGVFVRKGVADAKKIVEDQSKKINEMRMQLLAERKSIVESAQELMEEAEKTK